MGNRERKKPMEESSLHKMAENHRDLLNGPFGIQVARPSIETLEFWGLVKPSNSAENEGRKSARRHCENNHTQPCPKDC
jgi:hypothetical protein